MQVHAIQSLRLTLDFPSRMRFSCLLISHLYGSLIPEISYITGTYLVFLYHLLDQTLTISKGMKFVQFRRNTDPKTVTRVGIQKEDGVVKDLS